MTSPLVSIIVPSKNSASTLRACLDSIRNQDYANTELLVIDNFSKDDTEAIATEHGAIVLQKGPERSSQVNFGVRNSSGKYIYRVDSDMVVGRSVITQAVGVCESYNLDGVVIRSVSDPTVSYWSKVRGLERGNLYSGNYNVAVRFLSRDAFNKIGGFDETLSGFEDYDLQDRFVAAGYKFGRISSGEVHLGEPKTLKEIALKHYYYGKFLTRYLQKGNPGLKRLSPIRTGQRSILSQVADKPELLPGFFAYQFVRYSATFMGFLSTL